jgi:5'-nucleotidase
MTLPRRHALITNDDGIDSYFLHALVESLLVDFDVTVAAPATEQSWIGRAISRRRKVKVTTAINFPLPCKAWAIDGTPTDCVNIALGHLLLKKPDVVVSGINLGYNTTQNLIFCSGTVAGATEGAFWGLPAIAFSKAINPSDFEAVAKRMGRGDEALTHSLKAAAAHALSLTHNCISTYEGSAKVININFPPCTQIDSQVADTVPAATFIGSLFEPVPNSIDNAYEFVYRQGQELPTEGPLPTDLQALRNGKISRSILIFEDISSHPHSA